MMSTFFAWRCIKQFCKVHHLQQVHIAEDGWCNMTAFEIYLAGSPHKYWKTPASSTRTPAMLLEQLLKYVDFFEFWSV